MSVKEDFSDLYSNIGSLESESDSWLRLYEELMKSGTKAILPFGVDDNSTNRCLAVVRVLQAKAAAFDSLCETPPSFHKPPADDFNNRMFQEGANRVHGLVLELNTIANNTLDDYEDSDWVKSVNRSIH